MVPSKEKVFGDLQKILDHDPVIATKRAADIRVDPNNVKNYYDIHAATHMPLGQTDEYFERIFTCVAVNKGALVGGVVGGYGLGKTSLMLYFWKKAQERDLLAVPPYSWEDLQDHFDAAYYWTKYYLTEIRPASKEIVRLLDGLYEKYDKVTKEALAKKWSKADGIPYEKAINRIEQEVENGILRLEHTPEELLEFYSDLSKLVKEAGLLGLVVFTDELQQTITSKNFKEISGALFKIVNGILSRDGFYGILFGMPMQTQARFSRERKDVLDRLHSRNCFFDLGQIYDQRFPQDLWAMYVKHFDLSEIAEGVVDSATLVSMNQICDSRRPDLGNGPRSAISAFTAMISHYKQHNSPYAPIDFVEDCLSGKVELGDKTKLAPNVKDLLSLESVRGKYVKEVKFLAAFPSGTTSDIEKSYTVEDGIADFLRVSGGFGKVVIRAGVQGHALKILQPPGDGEKPENPLEEHLSAFYSEFSLDQGHKGACHEVFLQEIIPNLFFPRSQSEVAGWLNESERWMPAKWGHQIVKVGTFDESLMYPSRRVRIQVVGPFDEAPPALELNEEDTEHKGQKDPIDFVFRFEMNWDPRKSDFKGSIEFPEWPSRVVRIVVNPFLKAARKIDLIHGSIPIEKCSSFLYLSLIGHLSKSADQLGSAENQTWGTLKSDLIKETVNSLFNESMLDVLGAEVNITNWGDRLVREVFKVMCEKNFPEYRTIMSSRQFEKKIIVYKQVLNNQEVTLAMKRGRAPLRKLSDGPDVSPREVRNHTASFFGRGATGFDEWVTELGPLVDRSSLGETGEITLTLHPLEKEILDGLEKSDYRRTYGGKECKSIKARSFLEDAVRKGYRYEEIRVLMEEIGPARRIFDLDIDCDLIYKLPGTLDEDKKELEENLGRLRDDVAVLSERCPDFQARPLRDLEKEIRDVADEEAAERGGNKLKEERSHLDFFIKNCAGQRILELKTKLGETTLPLAREEVRISRALKAKPEGSAVWLESLATIQQRLSKTLSSLKNDITNMEREVKKLETSNERIKLAQFNLNVKEFDEFYKESVRLHTEVLRISSEWTLLQSHALDLENWIPVAATYKATFDKATSIEQNMGNTEIRLAYEKESEGLREFLKDEMESGLRQWEAWKNKIQSICDKADGIVGKCRTSFMEYKSSLAQAIKKAVGMDVMIRTGFEENDVQNSYQMLGSEFSDILSKSLSELRRELAELTTNMRYSERFLNLSEDIERSGIERLTDSASKNLDDIETLISPETFSKVEGLEVANRIANVFEGVRADFGRATAEMRKMLAPRPVDTDSREFLEIVAEAQQSNLKDVILKLKDRKEDLTLEEMLEILKVCFIHQQIDITLKRKS